MQKQKEQIILIRHGQSKYNQMHEVLQNIKKQKGNKEQNEEKEEQIDISKSLRFNKDYIDSPLTELGISQSEQLYTTKLEQMKGIKVVLVSPLLRGLQTAYHALKNYKPAPWIIVIPELAEYLSTSNDIGMNTWEYSKLKEFKEFDFSRIDDIVKCNQLWNITNLESDEKRATLSNILDMKCPIQKNLQTNGPIVLLDYLKHSYIETPSDFQIRSLKVKEIINQIINDYLTNEEDKIIIISHARLIQQFIPIKCGHCEIQSCTLSNSNHS